MHRCVSFHFWCGVIAVLTSFVVTAQAGDFQSSAAALIGRELDAIRAEHHKPLQWETKEAPLPASRRNAPAELREAWSYFRSVYRPAKLGVGPDDRRGISFQTNEARFYAGLDRILRGENKSALNELSLFRWGSWCGTGSDRMTEPMTWARWLVLLRERRLAEAVAASLEVWPQGMASFAEGDPVRKLQLQLFEICGIDSEKLLAGMALYSRDGDHAWEGMPAAVSLGGGRRPAEILAAEGCERGARYLLQLAGIIRGGERREYVEAMMLLLKPAGYNRTHATSSATPSERSSPDPLPADLQREVTRTLGGWIDDLNDTYTLRKIIGMLAEVHGTVEREALRKLLTHWSSQVANTAAEALRKLGEETGPLRKREPVRFRILVNGQPFAGRNMSMNIAMSDGSSLYGPEKTDANGVATIERDYLSDPKRKISQLTLFTRPSNSAPWFNVVVPVPPNLDLETPVNILAEPVTFVLTLSHPDDFYRGKDAVVSLTRLDAQGVPSSDYVHGRAKWSMPVAPEIVLPGVQPGEYDIEIQVPGSAPWKARRQKLGTSATRLRAALKSE